jgi:hypothetical protein
MPRFLIVIPGREPLGERTRNPATNTGGVDSGFVASAALRANR